MRIGFAVLLNDETHNFARNIELELCKKFGFCWGLKQSPHITIKPPFETDDLEKFENYLEKKAKEISSFNIEIDGFDYFKNPNVIFLNIKENKRIKQLQEDIRDELKNEHNITPTELEGDVWRFHSSVALKDVDKKKLNEALTYLKNKKAKFKFKANTLGLFYFLGEDKGWIIIKRVRISN